MRPGSDGEAAGWIAGSGPAWRIVLDIVMGGWILKAGVIPPPDLNKLSPR